MRTSPVEKQVVDILAPSLEDMGYWLVRVKHFTRPRGSTLQVMAERKDNAAMTVEDCETISRHISALLDVADPIRSAYDLEVSSPGIDRPLVRLQDFVDYAGFEAKIETSYPLDGRKRFRGELLGVEGEDIRIRVDNAEFNVPVEAVDEAKLVLTEALIKAHQSGKASVQQD